KRLCVQEGPQPIVYLGSVWIDVGPGIEHAQRVARLSHPLVGGELLVDRREIANETLVKVLQPANPMPHDERRRRAAKMRGYGYPTVRSLENRCAHWFGDAGVDLETANALVIDQAGDGLNGLLRGPKGACPGTVATPLVMLPRWVLLEQWSR